MGLKERLRTIIGDKTAKGLAERLGLHPNTLSRWSDDHLPKGEDLQALNRELGVNIHWLLTGEGEPFPSGPKTLQAPSPPEQKPAAQAPHGVAHSYVVARAPVSPDETMPSVDIPVPPACDPTEFGLVPMSEARLSASGGAFVSSERIKGYYAFRKEWLHRISSSPRHLVLVAVEGDSMAPTLCQGDTILIDVGRRHIYPGRIYALGIDDTVMVKRLEPLVGGNTVRVISDNRTEYPPREVERHSLRVIGQVIWYARELVQRE